MKFIQKTGVIAALCAASGVFSGLATSAQAQPKINIQNTTPAALKSAVARGKGKPTVVKFWATWCSTCVSELPTMAKIRRANAGKANVILVAAGETAPNAQVAQTLRRTGNSGTMLFRSDIVAFFDKFAPSYKGTIALPVTMIFDKNGRLVKTETGEHTQAEFQKLINPYLK